MTRWRRSSGVRSMVLIGVLITVLGSGSVMGGMFSRLDYMLHSWPPQHRVKQLLITGNYAKSRLLAELVQHHSKQPILLVSPTQDGNDLYFLPYGPEAMKLKAKNVTEFVELVNPREVLFIGDSAYLPDDLVNRLRDRLPSVRISSGNWAQNARTLATMFKYRKLPQKFATFYDKLASKSQRINPSLGR